MSLLIVKRPQPRLFHLTITAELIFPGCRALYVPMRGRVYCLLLLIILILILERHNSLWSITLEMDIVFAGAGGGISGGCFELTEPALNCEGIS